MQVEKNIDSILSDLRKKGSRIDYLEELKTKFLFLSRQDIDLEECLEKISRKIKQETELFLYSKNKYNVKYISGISTCIYLPDFDDNGEYKLKIMGGNKSRQSDDKIDENTLFDVASITKLFSLLLLFILEELNLIDLDKKISDINHNFKNLEDFTLNDLIRLHGELRTNGKISEACNSNEAYEIFKTLYLSSNTREKNKYTDFGAMVISDTIEQVISEKLDKKMTYDEIMYKYLLEPLGLFDTTFTPKTNISGNGNNLGLVNDSKARILNKPVGHSGIFTTTDDLAKLSKGIFSKKYLDKKHIDRLGEITFPNSIQNMKGNLGIYVKHPKGWNYTYTAPEYSIGSFSSQGWTGSVASFDPNNLIHNSILVNSIYKSDDKEQIKNNKPIDFFLAFDKYQRMITKYIMVMYISKKYYNKYLNDKENIVKLMLVK